VTITKDKLRR